MIVAVTGANGHVGSNLCRILLNAGHKVRALVFMDSEGIEGLPLEKVKGDLLSRDSLDGLLEGSDTVIHLAAVISILGRQNSRLEQVNVDGTRNVIEAARRNGVKRFIHFSSIHALDHSPLDRPMDENRPLASGHPLPYERTKANAEKIVREAAKNGLDAMIVNPTAMIGPHDYKPSLMGQLLIRLYKRQIPALVPGGYDWVDVRDVCRATVDLLEKGERGDRYILAGKWLSLRDLSIILGKVTGRPTPTHTVPYWGARIGVPFIKAWYTMMKEHPLYTSASLDIVKSGSHLITSKKAEDALKYSVRPIEETLADTISFFRKNGFIK